MQEATRIYCHDYIQRGVGVVSHRGRQAQVIKPYINGEFDAEATYKAQLDAIADAQLLGDVLPEVKEFFCYPVVNKIRWTGGELIAGSSIANMVNPMIPADDVDVYFKSLKDAKEFMSMNNMHHALNKMQPHYRCVWVRPTDHVSYNLIWSIEHNTPQELIAGFDIRACAVAYDPTTGKLYAAKGALPDIEDRRIVYQTTCRNVTTKRLLKYISKGFNIDKYQRCVFSELMVSGRHNMELEMHTGYGV